MPDIDGAWSQLRFEEVVLTEFRFLESDYAFVCRQSTPSCVEYEGRHGVRVVVRHDHNSFEIAALVERGDPGAAERFTVWELARLAGAPEVKERTFLQASTSECVAHLVPKLAEVLRTYGAAALRAEESAFRRLRALQAEESERFLEAGRLRRIREEVHAAWRDQDYKLVVRLLEQIDADLSPSEVAKLKYARANAHG